MHGEGEKDQKIEELRRRLAAARQQLAELEQQLATARQQAAELEQQLATAGQQAAEQEGNIASLRRLGAACEAEAARLREQLRLEVAAPVRRKLPAERPSLTHKFEVAGHVGYVTVGLFPDGRPGEIFVVIGKEGATLRGFGDAWARAVSLLLQYGVPLDELVRKFAGFSFEPAGWTSEPRLGHARSIIDYLVRWLALRFGVQCAELAQTELPLPSPLAAAGSAPGEEPQGGVEPPPPGPAGLPPPGPAGLPPVAPEVPFTPGSGPPCPECGALTISTGSCHSCPGCGQTSGCS